jgi:predicted Zn-dependent peptidase
VFTAVTEFPSQVPQSLTEHFDKVLSGMKDMVFHPLLKNKDVLHEKSVITQEAWGRYKNEKYLRYTREILENVFYGTKKERISSPLGWPESILKIKQSDIKKWHKENYGKGNFYIVIAGCIDKNILSKIEKFLKNIPTIKTVKKDFGKLSKPKRNLIEKTGDEIGDPKEQVEITFERTLESKLCPNPEIINMTRSLLSDILFEKMRTEKALCYGVNVFYGFQKDFFQFGVNVNAKEENKQLIIGEFNKAIKSIVSGKELKRFQTLKKVNIDKIKSKEEVTEEITENALHSIWQYGKVFTRKESLSSYEKITYKDVSGFL